jgi:hypothetical protein
MLRIYLKTHRKPKLIVAHFTYLVLGLGGNKPWIATWLRTRRLWRRPSGSMQQS